MSSSGYLRPAATFQTETTVARSRFIATIARAETVEQAKAALAAIHQSMPDASHHVYAYVVGHGRSVTEGLSDAGEPSGTAGQPVMAVLRGSGLGDTIIVVTRYFGGIKLGTGGLVRAYTEAAQTALAGVTTEAKIPRMSLTFRAPYSLYKRTIRLVREHDGEVVREAFAEDVSLEVVLQSDQAALFQAQLRELSAGKITPSAHDI